MGKKIQSDNVEGKLPPSAKDLEEAVLGAIMLEKQAFKEVKDKLNADDFYVDAHSKIYEAISQLEVLNYPIDILTVTNQLKKNGTLELVGGAFYISRLTNRVSSSANILFHTAIVKQYSLLRKLIKISTETIVKCYDMGSDPFKVIEELKTSVVNIEIADDVDITPYGRMKNTMDAIARAQANDGMAGIPTGIRKLDRFIGGITDGDLYVFGGQSGAFKTALQIYIQHQVSVLGVPTLMFQQEMTDVQLGYREIALKTGMEMQDLRRGRIADEKQYNQGIQRIIDSKVFVDVSVNQTLWSIKARTQRAISEHGVRFIVIDYLNLCDLEVKKHGNEEQAIAYFVKNAKAMAKELKIGVLLLVQFTKESGKDPLKLPQLNWIKGSGAVEFSADVICLAWNPSQHDDNFEFEGKPTKDKLLINVAKNKNGERGVVFIGLKAGSNQFYDIDDNEYNATQYIEPNINFETENNTPAF